MTRQRRVHILISSSVIGAAVTMAALILPRLGGDGTGAVGDGAGVQQMSAVLVQECHKQQPSLLRLPSLALTDTDQTDQACTIGQDAAARLVLDSS